MTEMVQGRFTLDLLELPAGDFVKLSDALELALYGGIRSIRDEDLVPRSAIAAGMFLGTDSGTLLLETDWGWIVGPKEINVARPGAVLFGVEDNSEPDAIETAAREQWYQARLKRHELVKEQQAEQAEMLGLAASDRPALSPPRPHDPAGINPFWQAEIMRKREQFFASLNVAARRRKCALGEFLCFHCKKVSSLTGRTAEIEGRDGRARTLRWQCPRCGKPNETYQSRSQAEALERIGVTLTTSEADYDASRLAGGIVQISSNWEDAYEPGE